MKIKAYYAGGRIDVFDTDCMTDGIPQPGNLLTNYTLDLSDVGEECLWLRSYYYEAVDAYKDEKSPTGLPVARRRDGWCFLIADEEDLQKLYRVTLDGETLLIRIAYDIVDASTLSWAFDSVEEYRPKIISSYPFLSMLCDFSLAGEDEPHKIIGLSFDSMNIIASFENDIVMIGSMKADHRVTSTIFALIIAYC